MKNISGMDLSKIKLFAHFPEAPEVRGDVADYYFEVQRFDRVVGEAIAALEEAGELDNTIIVMSGDHGMRTTEGILGEAERAELVQLARDHGGHMTGKRNSDGSVAPYELNLNYFDAVNDPRAEEPESLQSWVFWRSAPHRAHSIRKPQRKSRSSDPQFLSCFGSIRKPLSVFSLFIM